jgi:hypothetical protein
MWPAGVASACPLLVVEPLLRVGLADMGDRQALAVVGLDRGRLRLPWRSTNWLSRWRRRWRLAGGRCSQRASGGQTLGGGEDRPTRPAGRSVLMRGRRRLLDRLVTETLLADAVRRHGQLPPRLAAPLRRPATG